METMSPIAVVDYGMGNLGSILNMLRKIGANAYISSNPDEIAKAKKIILPGVGAFGKGMDQIRKLGFYDVLNEKVLKEKVPLMGICLGMQLFTGGSEEGEAVGKTQGVSGFGWIAATTVKFNFEQDTQGLKVPHMGWNRIGEKQQSPLFEGLNNEKEARFYFAHSYHVICEHQENILATTRHGYSFASVIGKGNIIGVQFHPEKSHKYGMLLMKNFFGLF